MNGEVAEGKLAAEAERLLVEEEMVEVVPANVASWGLAAQVVEGQIDDVLE